MNVKKKLKALRTAIETSQKQLKKMIEFAARAGRDLREQQADLEKVQRAFEQATKPSKKGRKPKSTRKTAAREPGMTRRPGVGEAPVDLDHAVEELVAGREDKGKGD